LTLKLNESVPRRTLKDCEAVIERSLRTLIVGEALRDIRDRQLYAPQHPSFEIYCRKRWGLAHRRVARFVEAAEVAQFLAHHGLLALPDAKLAHELAPLLAEPERLMATWIVLSSLEAVPSATLVRTVVLRVEGAPLDLDVESIVTDAIAEHRRPNDSHQIS
jgi:hypothetical protein